MGSIITILIIAIVLSYIIFITKLRRAITTTIGRLKEATTITTTGLICWQPLISSPGCGLPCCAEHSVQLHKTVAALIVCWTSSSVANQPDSWQSSSEIITAPGDFPDNSSTPDHRPVQAIFNISIPQTITIAEPKAQLLVRKARLEAELEALRAIIEGLWAISQSHEQFPRVLLYQIFQLKR